MRAHIIKNKIIVNTVVVDELGPDMIDATLGGSIGWAYDNGVFTEPEPEPIPVILDVLTTDTWTIPAGGETFATVTYTSDTTVYFAVESEIHTVEPVDQIATLEVTADATGPIRIDVQDQRLVIAALEV